MLPYSKKNFRRLLDRADCAGRVRIFCNAVVTGFATGANSSATIQEARAVSENGKAMRVTARRFVIAAGAIESARVLLELNRASAGRLLRPNAAAGCYLGDHLSVAIAEVSPDTGFDSVQLFGPRFDHDWMRVVRFLETEPLHHAPRAFAHFTFDTQGPGFRVAKELFGAAQARRRPRVRLRELVSGCAELANLGIHRYAKRRLYVRRGSRVELQLDVEQVPQKSNKVTLGHGTDRYGRPPVDIHWRIADHDIANIKLLALRFLQKWPGRALSLPTLIPSAQVYGALKPHDAYHPVGTCRMGRDSEAVVDENLKVWGVDNLWVVSTGVLPSAGTANPTFTMLCFAEDLAERMAAPSGSASVESAPEYTPATHERYAASR
jgi:choline dehydrogenase-like flavoprotein